MVKQNQKLLASALVVALVICFIFSNSLKNGEESKNMSGWVMELLQRIIDPAHRLDREKLHFFVRKGAHFTEFAALGASLVWLRRNIKERFHQSCAGITLFAALFVAVIDEFIQRFTGRTSSVTDVLLDFSGALFAMVLLRIAGIIFFHTKHINK